MPSSSKNLVTRLKVGKTQALTVRLLPLALGVEGFALALVIVVDGVGVNVANQALVMEK